MKLREIYIKHGHYIIIIPLILPFLFYLVLIDPYIPGFDEACQIEAAIRLSMGHGNTYSWMMSNDLSVPNFSFQNAWPMGYSVSLGALLLLGLRLASALKFLKLLLVLFTTFSWIRLSEFFIKDIWLRMIFAGCVTAYCIKYAQSLTDLVVVLFVSILSILILTRDRNERTRMPIWSKRADDPFIIGILIAIILLFKYSGMYLVACCSIWILFKSGIKKRAIINLLKFFIPVILIIVYIIVTNQRGITSAYAITANRFILNIPFFYEGWANDLLNAIFHSTYFDKVLGTLFHAVSEDFISAYNIIKTVFFLVFFITFYVLFRHGGKYRELCIWILINYFSLIIFLKLVSGFYFEDVLHWLPLKDGRYYWPIVLFLPLGILIITESRWKLIPSVWKTTTTVLITGGMFIGVCFYSNYKYELYRSLNAEIPLLKTELAKVIKNNKNILVFADQINWQTYPDKGKYNVFVQAPKFLNSHHFSEKTIVIMLSSSNNYLPAEADVDPDVNTKFYQLANMHNFNLVKVGTYNTLFWKEFPAGYSFN